MGRRQEIDVRSFARPNQRARDQEVRDSVRRDRQGLGAIRSMGFGGQRRVHAAVMAERAARKTTSGGNWRRSSSPSGGRESPPATSSSPLYLTITIQLDRDNQFLDRDRVTTCDNVELLARDNGAIVTKCSEVSLWRERPSLDCKERTVMLPSS